jgi:hypothetical protein
LKVGGRMRGGRGSSRRRCFRVTRQAPWAWLCKRRGQPASAAHRAAPTNDNRYMSPNNDNNQPGGGHRQTGKRAVQHRCGLRQPAGMSKRKYRSLSKWTVKMSSRMHFHQFIRPTHCPSLLLLLAAPGRGGSGGGRAVPLPPAAVAAAGGGCSCRPDMAWACACWTGLRAHSISCVATQFRPCRRPQAKRKLDANGWLVVVAACWFVLLVRNKACVTRLRHTVPDPTPHTPLPPPHTHKPPPPPPDHRQ